ncbi:putative exonuclease, RecJ [Halothece sp. PCC 7418]|uniref:single-stranded-DNA-specific exonuclease RecJ n=1 Tax=Halothece sp. (strain PCC 7418) TaxID=65093 RepID=UPI0002A06DC5|nr:single-stranded-DNA-specific exonuclease RecJ [Halothece sp. PCC 7418]AFZ45673.1 putative exonuclease, RecJ [Halothece sp. PCC 7418]
MSHWQILPQLEIPDWFFTAVETYCPQYPQYVAQLLWQRGIDNLERLQQFLDLETYTPTSGFAGFGQQMDVAVKRCQQAWENQEKVVIWGDFDADGVTATSVLWEGLQPFFTTSESLSYYIPNRLTESHGLNEMGLRKLAGEGVELVITCDTGSTNLAEMEVAKTLGIDIIVTDHHTLPEDDPNVVAILNPKYLAQSHPLYHLSGVAVAYKLIEALSETFPEIPEKPAETLLDLVAIGLIADLVELQGDCRYLAQKGIQQLAQQLNHPTRPGIAQLLRLCQRNGDRPMDIAFGIGPRINAISRIQGDATFAVELLTSEDETVCQKLAQKTEIANTRRKELQKDVESAVKRRIEELDLSTTSVIVLADSQWQPGVLGLVAGQIAQEYARPTILLNLDQSSDENISLARGSARSVEKIDLYQLLRSQQHLLHRFGGHPFAAGLSMKAENLSIFREAINQQFRQRYGNTTPEPSLNIDLTVTVEELGQDLFQSLKLLEPYGMGNPLPRLLIQNCWFKNVWNNNIKDYTGNKIRYIRTTFKVCDETNPEGFPGMWWGHYKDELPENKYFDAVVELDFNAYEKEYEVRIVEVKAVQQQDSYSVLEPETPLLLDYRGENASIADPQDSVLTLDYCPRSWEEMSQGLQEGIKNNCAIALTYSPPNPLPAEEIWKQFLGIAKYLSRTQQTVSRDQLQNKLRLSQRTIELGLNTLDHLGFQIEGEDRIQIVGSATIDRLNTEAVQVFLAAIQEEQFRCQYFTEVPLEMIREEGLSH